MSISIMSDVWKLDLPDSEKIVLLALADCANDEGLAWPSMVTLARKCSKSERTCQAVIKSLKNKGLITREEIIGKGCRYTLNPRKPRTPAVTAPPQGTALTPAAAAPKPSRTIKEDKSSKTRETFDLPDWIPIEPWNGWIEMRIAKRAKPTPRALRLAVADLDRLRADGHDPADVLDQSTMKCWTGLFPLKSPISHPPIGNAALYAHAAKYQKEATA